MKKTENYVDEILKEHKQELQNVAREALQNFLYERVKYKLVVPLHSTPVLCAELSADIIEKIDLFLVAEGYEK